MLMPMTQSNNMNNYGNDDNEKDFNGVNSSNEKKMNLLKLRSYGTNIYNNDLVNINLLSNSKQKNIHIV